MTSYSPKPPGPESDRDRERRVEERRVGPEEEDRKVPEPPKPAAGDDAEPAGR